MAATPSFLFLLVQQCLKTSLGKTTGTISASSSGAEIPSREAANSSSRTGRNANLFVRYCAISAQNGLRRDLTFWEGEANEARG